MALLEEGDKKIDEAFKIVVALTPGRKKKKPRVSEYGNEEGLDDSAAVVNKTTKLKAPPKKASVTKTTPKKKVAKTPVTTRATRAKKAPVKEESSPDKKVSLVAKDSTWLVEDLLDLTVEAVNDLTWDDVVVVLLSAHEEDVLQKRRGRKLDDEVIKALCVRVYNDSDKPFTYEGLSIFRMAGQLTKFLNTYYNV